MRTRAVKYLACCTLFASGIAACGSNDKDGGSDAGMNGGMDVGGGPADAMPLVDAGAHDAGGMRPDGGGSNATDATPYCAVNNEVQVGATQVPITAAPAPATANGNAANAQCIDQQPTTMFQVSVFFRGCLEIAAPMGMMTTQAELNALDIAVFPAKDPVTGAAIDPSWNRTTGADTSSAARVPVQFTVDTNVAQASCPSRLQLTIGFQTGNVGSLASETEYIIRARTATTAPMQNVWATAYYYDIIVRDASVSGTGGQLANCSPNRCSLRHNFTLIRGDTLHMLGAANQIPGSADLSDGMGAGYAMFEAYDCSDLPMKNAVVGFAPAPIAKGYLDTNNMLDLAAVGTSDKGIFLALGFMGMDMTATAPATVTAAIGVQRQATQCTEEFGGRTLTVFPDSISVLRSSAEIVLHTH